MSIAKSANSGKVQNLVLLSIFTAIIILMAFTPLGYLRTGGLEITFILIPVAVGAILLGPLGGGILGAVFGLTSFIQCFGFSPFGAILLGINGFYTFILCMVPRVLVGYLTAVIFRALQRVDKTKLISYAVSCLCSALLNTLLFMGALLLFFWPTDYIQGIAATLGASNLFLFVGAFVGINGLVEAAVCLILGTAIAKALYLLKMKMTPV